MRYGVSDTNHTKDTPIHRLAPIIELQFKTQSWWVDSESGGERREVGSAPWLPQTHLHSHDQLLVCVNTSVMYDSS